MWGGGVFHHIIIFQFIFAEKTIQIPPNIYRPTCRPPTAYFLISGVTLWPNKMTYQMVTLRNISNFWLSIQGTILLATFFFFFFLFFLFLIYFIYFFFLLFLSISLTDSCRFWRGDYSGEFCAFPFRIVRKWQIGPI